LDGAIACANLFVSSLFSGFTFKGNEDAGVLSSIFSLFNGSVGASTLAFPLVFQLLGFIPATLALALVACCGYATNILLVRVCVAEDCRSYDKAIERILSRRVLHVFQFFMVSSGWILLCAYKTCTHCIASNDLCIGIVLIFRKMIFVFPCS
jgi:amino acid permease